MVTVQLFEAAAKRMCGRYVQVRLRAPIIKQFDGQALIYGVRAVVDIRPTMPDENLLTAFCHECAHIRNKEAADYNPNEEPESRTLSAYSAWSRVHHPKITGIEERADRMARLWLSYAKSYFQDYPGGTTLERQLRALAHYPRVELNPDEIKAAIERMLRRRDY